MRGKSKKDKNIVIGWKEWFSLEGLGLPFIKGKIDTGAKTSSLHAFNIKTFTKNEQEYVKFQIHPLQKNQKITQTCITPITDYRYVSDSSGKKEKRYVIESILKIGEIAINIEITLSNRDTMIFRMLLGREAIKKAKIMVDVSGSFLQGKIKRSLVLEKYNKIA
jgi:ribosomal protein S6--L-glutamate ligase